MEPLSHNIEDYPEGIILPIDKPYRWTSADVIRKVKYAAIRHFGKKNLKVGHAGTLDPLATGILLVCIGPATKRAEELQRSAKQYVAGVTFGATTPSYDLEKEIDAQYPLDGVSRESLLKVLPGFIGEQEQVAPLFSAKSVDGVRAYEMARKMYREHLRTGSSFNHEQSELLSRQNINIYGLELLEFSGSAGATAELPLASLRSIPPTACGSGPLPLTRPRVDTVPSVAPADPVFSRERNTMPDATAAVRLPGDVMGAEPPSKNPLGERIHVADISGYDLPMALIRVDCSKGTYIRALARDLGEALGSGAFLSSLRRTGNGGFTIEDAISLDDAMQLLNSGGQQPSVNQ